MEAVWQAGYSFILCYSNMSMENCLIIDYSIYHCFFCVASQRNNVILSHPKMVEACTTQIDKVSFGASEFLHGLWGVFKCFI